MKKQYITVMLDTLFDTTEQKKRWLQTRFFYFHGKTPREMIEDRDCDPVLDLLGTAIAFRDSSSE